MQLLKIKPATQLVNGQKVPCYGIYCGYELMRTVSAFEYDETRTMIKAANAVINHQAKAVVDQAKRKAAAKRRIDHLRAAYRKPRKTNQKNNFSR